MPLEHVENLRLERRAREHAVDQVGPIERSHQLGGVAQAELRDDVLADARGGGGRVGVQADRRPAIAQARQLPVFRAEVVAPLADAVRFVHGDEADRLRRQQVLKSVAALAHQPFRRHIQQPVLAFPDAARHFGLLLGRHRAVVAGRRHAVADQRVDLILHQRNQRRHDDGEPVAGQGRRLKAQRLAAAGRQHQQRIAVRHHGFHGLALQAVGSWNSPRTVRGRPDERVARPPARTPSVPNPLTITSRMFILAAP